MWLPDGILTTTVYDTVGNPIATVSPLGFISTQVFDSRKRLIGRQDPLGRFHSLVYDNAGRVWMQQDGKGQITTHLYVNCGDESVRTYADGTRVSFSYNSLRQLVGVADPSGLRTFSYDPVGRLQSVVGPEHPSGQPITYGYDSNSNRTLLQSWQGLQTYIYDPRDLLVEVQDAGFYSQGVAGGTTSISYDARRQWITQTNPNGTRGTVLYDALGRAAQIRHSTSANVEIAHAVSTYDPAGRLTLLQTQAGAFSYGYDVLNQLSSEVSPYTSLLSYGYDANHRRRFVQSGATLSTYNYDAADQLLTVQTGSSTLTYSYDANGSTLVFPSGSALTTFSWDAANRLQSVHLPGGGLYTHLYRFDDLRRGMASPSGVIDTFVYAVVDPATQKEGLVGLGASPPEVNSSLGGGISAVVWSSEAAPLLWWQRSGGASEWLVQSGEGAGLLRAVGQESSGGALNREYHLDNMGHVGATSTGSGSLETAFSYGAWGTVAAGSAVDNSLDYGGGWGYWHDATLGLSYVRARWMNPITGSWLSVDPVSSEPRYGYAHNMPTLRVDPSGRLDIVDDIRQQYQDLRRDWQIAESVAQTVLTTTTVAAAQELAEFEVWATPDNILAMMDRMQQSPLGLLFQVMPGVNVAIQGAKIGYHLGKLVEATSRNVEQLLPNALAHLVPKTPEARRKWMWAFATSTALGFVTEAINEIPGVNQFQLMQMYVNEFKYFQAAGFTLDTVFQYYVNDPIINLLKQLGESSDVPAELIGGLVGAQLCILLITFLKELVAALAAPETGGLSEEVINADVAVEQGGRVAALAQNVAQRLRSGKFGKAWGAIRSNPQILSAFKRLQGILKLEHLQQAWQALEGRIGKLKQAIQNLANELPKQSSRSRRPGLFRTPLLHELETIQKQLEIEASEGKRLENQCIPVALAVDTFMAGGCKDRIILPSDELSEGNTLDMYNKLAKEAGHRGLHVVASPMAVVRELQAAGPGARGFIGVYVGSEAGKERKIGHVINVVYDGEQVKFIDGGGDSRYPAAIMSPIDYSRHYFQHGAILEFVRTDQRR